MEFVIFVLVGLAVAAVATFSWYLKQKRRQVLALMARQLGLDFSLEDTLGCLGLSFALLQRGDGRGTENVMWGTWQGMAVRSFD